MIRTIYKYPLAITDEQTVLIPSGGKILDAQFQGDQLCIWVLVDPIHHARPRTIVICGTGHPVPDRQNRYIATVGRPPFVWHVFEEIP